MMSYREVNEGAPLVSVPQLRPVAKWPQMSKLRAGKEANKKPNTNKNIGQARWENGNLNGEDGKGFGNMVGKVIR